MKAERFETLAEAYGADLSRWPMETREAADAFLAVHPRALDEAAALDAMLDASPARLPSAALLERLNYGAPRARAPDVRGLPGGARPWLSAAGLVAACVLGLMFGASLPTGMLVDPSTEAIAGAQTAFDTAADFGLEEFG